MQIAIQMKLLMCTWNMEIDVWNIIAAMDGGFSTTNVSWVPVIFVKIDIGLIFVVFNKYQ